MKASLNTYIQMTIFTLITGLLQPRTSKRETRSLLDILTKDLSYHVQDAKLPAHVRHNSKCKKKLKHIDKIPQSHYH